MLGPRHCRAALVLAGFSAMLQPASAQDLTGRDPPMVRVGFHDLDLSHSAGVETLNHRIRHAAKRLCASELRMASPLERSVCVKGAVRDSRKQIDVAIAGYAARQLAGGDVIEVAIRG